MSEPIPAAFVSYSREDSVFVLRLIEDLKAAGASVWLDQLDIEPGHAWDRAIEKALREAPRMLLVLSPASASSENVRNEISFALEEKKSIIPVLHQDCAIPLQLHRIQRVDLKSDYARGLNALLVHLGVHPVAQGAALAPAQAPPDTPPAVPPPPVSQPSKAATIPEPTHAATIPPAPKAPKARPAVIATAVALLLAAAVGGWLYHRWSERRWAHEQAAPEFFSLLTQRKSLAALTVLEQALKYSPSDPTLKQVSDDNILTASIASSPLGATVEVQDYVEPPDAPWRSLGVTPLKDVHLPNGYFRWKISKAGVGEMVVAGTPRKTMAFALDAWLGSPSGMVPIPANTWTGSVDFVGWLGPYKLPQYYIDRYEVTNRDYQKFVDSGGYEKKEYWTEKFTQGGHDLSWNEAMAQFRDPTGRPGPSTWTGGHFPEGKADFPVSGVSWFEASAYAAFAGKSLPILAQWYHAAPSDAARYIVPVSNISTNALASAGAYKGLGPFGTYDTAGNVREWIVNPNDTDGRLILGGSWKSISYLYYDPAALSPFDRSEENGFRCVKNGGPLPAEATGPVKRWTRDFSTFKPASGDVFQAYELLYAYPTAPLHEKVDGVVKETADWREEKVEFDTGYRGERMAAYLFLPKNVRPPYQTVLFFPSADIMFMADNDGGRNLGDIRFFDYIVQSGRAVMYPIYENTYERRVKFSLPRGAQNIQITTDWYKDAARSLDYLATRQDIDNRKLAYLGDSMGSVEGVIVAALQPDRLKTAIFLDGGYFLDPPTPGGDEADFAPRVKQPVLMVNGRYDYVFPLDKAQDPLFAMLGTPEKDKRHLILDTPHDVTAQRPQLTKAVLDWLDQYLGRVNE